ncbi:MAG TPA: class I SAM-dependent methyltransferase [Anaeromyxobacter sp.]|nr:class I SAM-dependent methyltransferase [Anaeromyxobacter sp.]
MAAADPELEGLGAALIAWGGASAPPSLAALARLEPTAAGVPPPPPSLARGGPSLGARLAAALAAPRPGAGFDADPAGTLADRILQALQARHPFLPLEAHRAELVRLNARGLEELARALSAGPGGPALGAALAPSIARYLAGLVDWARALEAAAGPIAADRPVVSAEYEASTQLRVLGLDPARLAEPILDLGCGVEARLVRALRARGLEARGIDRLATPAEGIRRASWLEEPLPEATLGTVISHLGFSLHLLHHHLRPGEEALRYARRYMEILRALRPGGVFAYVPGLPFLEEHLPTAAWRVERTPVDVPPPPPPPGAAPLPWYAARVSRLRR